MVLDPQVTRSLISLIGSALSADAMQRVGSVDVRRARRRRGRGTGRTLVDDPTLVEAFGAASHDAEGVPTRRLELIVAAGSTASCTTSTPPARGGTTSTGAAMRGGFKSTPGVGARALHLVPGTLSSYDEILASVPEALFVQSVSGLHSGTNP